MNSPIFTTDVAATLGIGAGVAALAAGWAQVKTFLARIAGLLVVTVRFDGGYAGSAAKTFCRLKLVSTPTAFYRFAGRIHFIRPRTRHGCVMYELLGSDGRLYWKGWKPVWASVGGQGNSPDPDNESITLRFIRGTFKADQLAMDVADCLNPHVSDDGPTPDRFRIIRRAGRSGKAAAVYNETGSAPSISKKANYTKDAYEPGRMVGWKDSDVGEVAPSSNPIDRLSLTAEVSRVVEEIKRWFTSKKWYAERQIAWRFGVLFHGKPGTGKSSLTKAMGQELKIPIYLLDISTMDNEEFHEAYQTALSDAPCIILIEDIDAVFHGRENVASEKGKGLTFDCLLNTISGVEASDGVLLVITTNNLEKVDRALGVPEPGSMSSRPGRIDRAVELPPLDEEGRRKLAKRVLAGCHPSWVEYMVRIGENDTGAQFEDRCATAALTLYWSNNPKAPAPTDLALVVGE